MLIHVFFSHPANQAPCTRRQQAGAESGFGSCPKQSGLFLVQVCPDVGPAQAPAWPKAQLRDDLTGATSTIQVSVTDVLCQLDSALWILAHTSSTPRVTIISATLGPCCKREGVTEHTELSPWQCLCSTVTEPTERLRGLKQSLGASPPEGKCQPWPEGPDLAPEHTAGNVRIGFTWRPLSTKRRSCIMLLNLVSLVCFWRLLRPLFNSSTVKSAACLVMSL